MQPQLHGVLLILAASTLALFYLESRATRYGHQRRRMAYGYAAALLAIALAIWVTQLEV